MQLLQLLASAMAMVVAVLLTTTHAQSAAKFSRRMGTSTNRKRRSGFYEVAFSDAEESVLIASQGETLEGISRLLGGRSVREVERRCVELGLRCGAAAKAPPKKSEKWRGGPRGE